MASSSSSPSAPAFSSQVYKYHVFLSFRGEDTRKTFVDHLYTALLQHGIHTYKDDETLPWGESINPSLEKAIEESQIAVIIFSQNYAGSSWCLEELSYIMRCRDIIGQSVMPVFFDVEPSVVRKQTQKYGEAISKYEMENNKKIDSWRQALVDAGSLSGNQAHGQWHAHMFIILVYPMCRHESKVIKEIVQTISDRLHPLTSSANENLIGMEARVEDLKSKLAIGSGGVRMIGIWGVGGGGKTTLALSVYSEISSKFDGCCFVENIGEESRKYGLEKLQEKILSNVLKRKEMEVNRVGGARLLQDRLRHVKVLIVLDDVYYLEHLEALGGSWDWFGEGSRIIITTRDKHVLTAHKVDVIYNIRLLKYDEAIKLFQKHAPRGNRHKEDYELLSREVVYYAGGLPLALRVLGRFLCDKDINEWRSALARLRKIPEADVVEKLKISYDGLKQVEKELFLDIACFFRGQYKNKRIMEMFDACGFYPVIGIKVLIDKALISVSKDGRFDMHDLVQEMGRYIVRGKHPNNPEKHSRVWETKDVIKLCSMDAMKELDMIEAIRFECNRYDPVELHPIIANMKNLRWFDWRGDLASPFPTNFSPAELCCLILDGISQKQLWMGYKHLPNLKILKLRCLHNLIMTPDFDGLPNLERFKLSGCRCLEEIHPSIGCLKNIVFLSIKNCPSLKIFPPIARLKKLETLIVLWCPKISNLPEIQQQNMDNLHPHSDDSWKDVASYITSYTNFFVTCCSNLFGNTEVEKPAEDLIDVEECCLEEPCLPHNNTNHYTILPLLSKGLRKLNLCYCNVGDKDISSAFSELPNLEELNLAGNKFSGLNFSLLQIPHRLKWLNVSGCKKLVELSGLPSSIVVLVADWCTSLERFGDISNCKWLRKVSLRGKNKLGPLVGDILLDSMLQGNAIEHPIISVYLNYQIPKAFVGRLFRRKTYILHLPDDWYNDFCGFSICIATNVMHPRINIIIRQKVDEDSQFELWPESNEALKLEFNGTTTFIGHVSFSSLKHTTLFNSSYHNMILFSIEENGQRSYAGETYVGAELIPRKKGDEVQMTDNSEFWDAERDDGTTFTLQHDSQSLIQILWQPYYYIQLQKVVVKVDIQNDKEKSEAGRAVSSISGVESSYMDMNKILTVIGDVDPVKIIGKLEECWDTEIVTIGRVKKKKEEAIRRWVEAYKAYNPYMTQHYHVHSIEDDPSSCVIC